MSPSRVIPCLSLTSKSSEYWGSLVVGTSFMAWSNYRLVLSNAVVASLATIDRGDKSLICGQYATMRVIARSLMARHSRPVAS